MNEKINLTPQEWKILVGSEVGKDSSGENWFQYMACVPELMQRCRAALNSRTVSTAHLEDLTLETSSLLEGCKTIIKTLRDRLEQYKLDFRPAELAVKLHAHYVRSLALALTTGIILDCISSRLEGVGMGKHESSRWAREIVQLAEVATRYQPLGSLIMIFCLHTAWVGATDAGTMEKIKTLLADYDRVCLGRSATDFDAELEKTRKRFSLEDA